MFTRSSPDGTGFGRCEVSFLPSAQYWMNCTTLFSAEHTHRDQYGQRSRHKPHLHRALHRCLACKSSSQSGNPVSMSQSAAVSVRHSRSSIEGMPSAVPLVRSRALRQDLGMPPQGKSCMVRKEVSCWRAIWRDLRRARNTHLRHLLRMCSMLLCVVPAYGST